MTPTKPLSQIPGADNKPVVEASRLSKVFRDFWGRPKVTAVRDLDLRVERGEVMGLLGPNGSGKSTTIKMLLGLLRPSNGRLALFGSSPDRPETRARIGYLPELTWLHPYMSPTETLHYYGALANLPGPERRRRTSELLAMVELESVAHRPIGEFSKGMARRVGIAQALIGNPDLIVLDEPTSGLDPIGSRQIKNLIRELAAQGRSILMSSHLLADVADVCNRISILSAGRLLAEGPVQALLQADDALHFAVEDIDPSQAESLRQEIERFSQRPVHTLHPSVTLESFFLRVVTESAGSQPPDYGEAHLAPFLKRTPDAGSADNNKSLGVTPEPGEISEPNNGAARER